MGIGPKESRLPTFCARRMACTKKFIAELKDVSGMWDLNEKKRVPLSSGLCLES